MEKIRNDIAGEINLSGTPGSTMKKWREIFAITQAELAQLLKISPSTISDYEGNRRKSPGSGVIKRFVNSLITIDNGHQERKFVLGAQTVSDRVRSLGATSRP